MKTYVVTRSMDGPVLLTANDGRAVYRVPHCVYHSPGGFETGYAGSGPADLALAILADYYCADPKEIALALRGAVLGDTNAYRAIRFHHEFKFEVVARRQLDPGQSWIITDAEVAQFLRGLGNRLSDAG
jgi:hypothetical protein